MIYLEKGSEALFPSASQLNRQDFATLAHSGLLFIGGRGERLYLKRF
jgi:hypothetical protein